MKKLTPVNITSLALTSLLLSGASITNAQESNSIFDFDDFKPNDYTVGDHVFSFHGYTRMGLMSSDNGKTAAHFQAPGAGAKFRLGNESDTQLRFQLNYQNKPKGTSETYTKVVVAVEDYQQLGNTRDFKMNQLPKAYIEFGNVLGGALGEGVSVWAGRRWYERKGMFMNDYFWINSGQKAHYGAGIEGIKVGEAELKLAAFKHKNVDAQGINAFAANKDDVTSKSYDARLLNMPLTDNTKLNLWSRYVKRGAEDTLGYDDETGLGLGFWFDTKNVFGGKNTFAVTHNTGASIREKTTSSNPINESAGYDLSKASMLEVNNTWLWDDKENYAVQWVTIYRSEDFGQDGAEGDTIKWYSTGVRPHFYINQHWSVATELGVDYVDNEIKGISGNVSKATVALQLSPNTGYMTRPVIRLYGTYATWSNDLVGNVGNSPDNAPYGNDNSGWTIGLQMEHIW